MIELEDKTSTSGPSENKDKVHIVNGYVDFMYTLCGIPHNGTARFRDTDNECPECRARWDALPKSDQWMFYNKAKALGA